jgi:hypothetical protein
VRRYLPGFAAATFQLSVGRTAACELYPVAEPRVD